MTSSILNHLPKTPSPNTTVLAIKASTCEFWKDTNIQSQQHPENLDYNLSLAHMHIWDKLSLVYYL
jgi:hypothetical protein